MIRSPIQLSRRRLLAAATGLVLARPVVALASQTDSAGGPIDFQARLGELLGAVPAREVTTGSGIPFYYADLAGQMEAVGLERPNPGEPLIEFPNGLAEAIYALPLASHAFQWSLDREWFDTFGFSPLAIGQSLDVSDPEGSISILAGGFDRQRVESALQAAGYIQLDQETGGSYWSFGDDWSPETAVGRLGVGSMNQAIVDDDLLIFTREESLIQQISWVRAGMEPSMLDQGYWISMAAEFSSDLVGMIPIDPGMVLDRLDTGEPPAATPAATPVSSTQQISAMVFGVRAGARSEPLSLVGEGTPEATPVGEDLAVPAQVEVRIHYADASLAEREVEAIPDRWETMTSMLTGQPYADLMSLEEAKISTSNPQVVALDFVTPVPNLWARLIHTVDLLPFLPAEG